MRDELAGRVREKLLSKLSVSDVTPDITRRSFLKGGGAGAVLVGASESASGGQITSDDEWYLSDLDAELLLLKETSSPGNPSSGKRQFFAKGDGVYERLSDGSESKIGPFAVLTSIDTASEWDQEVSTTGMDSGLLGTQSSIENTYTAGSLTEDLVAYYPMEQGGQVLFDGALGHHGRLSGPSWNGSGQVGSDSLDFGGSSDYVDTNDDLISEPFTVSLWFNSDGTPGSNEALLSNRDTNTSPNFVNVAYTSSDQLQFYQYDGSQYILNVDSSPSTWHHAVCVFDGSTQYVYQDGALAASQSASPSGVGTNDVIIGGQPNGSGRFDGQIDDVRIYDRALSAPEVEAIHGLTSPSGTEITESDVPSQSDSGVSRWEFENDVTDSWGSNDGTDNTSAGFVDGVFGQAKDFDGSDDGVYTTDSPFSFGTSDFSVSAWIKPETNPNYGSIATHRTTSDFIGWSFRTNSGAPELLLDDGSAVVVSGDSINTGRWYHVVATANRSGNGRVYVNGTLDSETDVSGVGDISTNIEMSIGYRKADSNQYFDGPIDDVRIYSQALAPEEVEQLYNKGAYRINRADVL